MKKGHKKWLKSCSAYEINPKGARDQINPKGARDQRQPVNSVHACSVVLKANHMPEGTAAPNVMCLDDLRMHDGSRTSESSLQMSSRFQPSEGYSSELSFEALAYGSMPMEFSDELTSMSYFLRKVIVFKCKVRRQGGTLKKQRP